jgi:predicted transcriptional regulator
MDKSDTPRHAPDFWIEAIEEGFADIAAGWVYDLDEVLAEFEHEDAAELAASRTAKVKQRRRNAGA